VAASPVRPADVASQETAAPERSGGSLFGETLSPAARDAVLGALAAIVLGALVMALVIADNLGKGPRRRLARRWQSQRLL
jgi:hypothetical protein